MSLTLDRKDEGWFLGGSKLPGIDVKAVQTFRQYGYWADKTIGDVIEDAAVKWPKNIALAVGARKITYEELNQRSSRLALGLLENGLGSGDMIAVQLPNSIEHILTIVAIAKIGAVCNIVVPLMRAKEVTHILKHCKSKAIVIPSEYAKFDYPSMIAGLSSETPSLETVIVVGDIDPQPGMLRFDDLLDGAPKKDHPSDALRTHRPHPDDLSLIGFTSGTTAMPKAYLHTHNTEYANSFNCMLADSYQHMKKPSVNIALPGFAWMYGRWCNVLSAALDGATNIVVDPFTPDGVIDAIAREKPTHIHGAPAMYHVLIEGILDLHKSGDLSLEAFHYAGSVMPMEMARRLREAAQILTCYGLSEISPVCGNSLMDSPEAQMRSSGRPAWGNQMILVDSDRQRVEVGEEGEIAVRGPGLTLGYLNQPEANSQAFIEDGLFLSGDLGFLDDAYYLNITGRSKDVIDRGGIKFSPREVEELLLGHQSIENVAVVGMPDSKLGERSCAFVVAKAGSKIVLEDAVRLLKEKGLATHKLPERLEIIEELPVTATGKVQKYRLRQRVAELLGRETAS